MATACIAKPAKPARLTQRPSFNSTQALHVHLHAWPLAAYQHMVCMAGPYGMHGHLQHISKGHMVCMATCSISAYDMHGHLQHVSIWYAWPIAVYAGQGYVHADNTNTYCDGPCHACVSPKVHQLGDGRPVSTRERYLEYLEQHIHQGQLLANDEVNLVHEAIDAEEVVGKVELRKLVQDKLPEHLLTSASIRCVTPNRCS